MNLKHLSARLFFLTLTAIVLFSCGSEEKSTSVLKEGTWRGKLILVDSIDLICPFNFELENPNGSPHITIRNAEERITVDEISFSGDSVFIRMPLFDSEFRCKMYGDTLLEGNWINHARSDKNIIPFVAIYGETNRFDCPEYDERFPFEGRWKCLFSPHQLDSFYAVGTFKQSEHSATGTFLTETGDYRYLEGCVFGNYMLLSCFDGSHAFVFHAQVHEDESIWGEFYSGIHYQRTWIAWKDSSFRLRNADSLTFLKEGYSKIDFSFQNLENKNISLSDERFKNKVTILQIMGSWCPNCTDETAFLSELYKQYNSKGLEVVSLAFEKTNDPEKAKNNVVRMKKKFDAGYEFLLSGHSPKEAAKALPMLNHIMSFPTTVFIDKRGNVRKIHTGYSGPATEGYKKFKNETIAFVESLLNE